MKAQISLSLEVLVRPGVINWDKLGYSFPPDAELSVVIDEGPDTPPPLKPPPPVVVAPPVDGTVGHMVTANPPYSATGIDTEFGYRDPGDNGIGFFTDPSTGRPYLTDNITLVGISLPREVLLSTFGISEEWRSISIDTAWAKHAKALRTYALGHTIRANVDGGGYSLRQIPLVDAGPKAGLASKALVDLTYGAALALHTGGKALCTFELIIDGAPAELKGINFEKQVVG